MIPTRWWRSAAAFAVAAAMVGAGCGGNGEATTDVGAFCAQASANQGLIVSPPLNSQDEINETIEFYRLLQQLAPLEIEDDWEQLIHMLNTANQIVPGDEASEQLVAQTAYASELAAYNIATYVADTCDLRLPITTIVPHEQEPLLHPFETVPTTVPGQDSVPGAGSAPEEQPGGSAPATPVAEG